MLKTVGKKLRDARQDRELSLEEVAKATFLRVHYLKALENGEIEALPSPAQARGFIRLYAGFLGLDPDSLLAEMQEQPAPAVTETPTTPYAAAGAEPVLASEIPTHTAALQAGQPFFSAVGSLLSEQRRVLGLSLDDVEKNTRLRSHYLRALESGSFAELPSSVQGRGMLKNYAAFLGMDPEPLLLRYAEGLQAMLSARQAERGGLVTLPLDPQAGERSRQEQPAQPPSRLRRLVTGELLIVIVLVAALIGFVGWGLAQISAFGGQVTPEATGPSIADVLLITPTPSPQPSPAGGTPQTQPGGEGLATSVVGGIPTEGGELPSGLDNLPPGAVQVYLVVHQRAWVQISVDGEVVLTGRVLPGSAYPFSGDEQVEVRTGNGAALQVYFNRQDLGRMGLYGEVVDRIFTTEGILAPTPSVTPTVTATVPATAAPAVTSTPQP